MIIYANFDLHTVILILTNYKGGNFHCRHLVLLMINVKRERLNEKKFIDLVLLTHMQVSTVYWYIWCHL